jgi:hypothetical protein
VDDDEEEEGVATMPENVQRIRCIDVADASKTVVHLVPGRNQVCILEYK